MSFVIFIYQNCWKEKWKKHVLFFLLVGVFGSALAQFIPPNFEAARRQPQNKLQLPKILGSDTASDFFIEPQPISVDEQLVTYRAVHMRVPKKSYLQAGISSGPFREYTVYLSMFYPDYSGIFDSQNTNCLHSKAETKVSTQCKNEMIVSFGFSGSTTPEFEERRRNNLQDELNRGYILKTALSQKYERLNLVGIRNYPNQLTTETTYYLSRDDRGKNQFVIQCLERVLNPVCETGFHSMSSPNLYIELRFPFSLLRNWENIIVNTRKKIDDFVVQTYTLKIGE